MNQSLINQYKIEFSNTIEKLNDNPTEIVKYPNIENRYLFLFLFDWSNAQDINLHLLPDIEAAFSDINYMEDSSCNLGVSIVIYHDRVELYDDNGFVYELPTQHFKEIVIGWRDFLLTPPLNGTRV